MSGGALGGRAEPCHPESLCLVSAGSITKSAFNSMPAMELTAPCHEQPVLKLWVIAVQCSPLKGAALWPAGQICCRNPLLLWTPLAAGYPSLLWTPLTAAPSVGEPGETLALHPQIWWLCVPCHIAAHCSCCSCTVWLWALLRLSASTEGTVLSAHDLFPSLIFA